MENIWIPPEREAEDARADFIFVKGDVYEQQAKLLLMQPERVRKGLFFRKFAKNKRKEEKPNSVYKLPF